MSHERGNVLIVTTLLILALIALGMTYLTVSHVNRQISSNAAYAARAFQLADGGLEDARSALPAQNLDTLLASGGALFTDTSLGGGTYSVTVTNNDSNTRFPTATVPRDSGGPNDDTDRFVVVTSTGTFRTGSRVVEQIIRISQSLFDYAVWADTKLTLSGSAAVDSYNSDTGTYAATVGSEGDVFTNDQINMSGSSMVHGDADVAAASGPAAGHVTGATTLNLPDQTKPLQPCPATYAPASSVICVSSCSYDAATGKLTVSSGTGSVIVNSPPQSLFFSEITLSGGSTMTYNNGGVHGDIYISGKLDLSGGSLANSGGKPTGLTIWACGPGTSDFKLSGGSGAAWAVYAPNRKVTVSGSAAIYGAVVAEEFDDSGSAAIHYDTALGGGTTATAVARSWREL